MAKNPTIRKTIARDRPNGDYLEITVEERDDSGTLSPGFSITGDLWKKQRSTNGRTRKRQGREQDVSGCLHEEILAAIPSPRSPR